MKTPLHYLSTWAGLILVFSVLWSENVVVTGIFALASLIMGISMALLDNQKILNKKLDDLKNK